MPNIHLFAAKMGSDFETIVKIKELLEDNQVAAALLLFEDFGFTPPKSIEEQEAEANEIVEALRVQYEEAQAKQAAISAEKLSNQVYKRP